MRRTDDRGQLLLIAAILMATVVVGTVVLLNGIQFVENTGSQDALRESKSVDQTVAELRPGLQQVLVAVENDTGPYVPDPAAGGADALRENVSTYTNVYANLTGYGTAALVDIGINGSRTVNGTAVGQLNGSYENTAGSADWAIAEDLRDSPGAEMTFLRMNVTNQSEDSTANFTLRFEDTAGARLDIEFNETTAFVDRSGASARRLCPGTLGDNATSVTVSSNGIRFDGNGTDDCEAVPLDPDPATSAPIQRVAIENGDQANGSLVATVGTDATPTPTIPPGTPVLESDAVINPAVDLTYDSSVIRYTSTIYVMGRNNA